MTFMISFGQYGGFYVSHGYGFRVCLGWMALTFLPIDIDILLNMLPAKDGEE